MDNGIIVKGCEIIYLMNDNGCFTQKVTDWTGGYAKEADKAIMVHLKTA
jgi:isoleucyl-tRNA synthetase